MTARLTVNGRALQADVSGALFQPDAGALIVADLHLEKGSHFARRGQFLPPYDTRATLEKLARVIRRFRPRRVVCLGDSFHDAEAGERIAAADRDVLRRLVAAQPWTWILGNHDPAIPPDLGGDCEPSVTLDGLVLRHEPAAAPATGEICGHLHPKASVAARGQRLTAACFVTDGTRLVMPAFGAYAGGLDVLDPAIARLFGRAGFRALLLGSERLHLVAKAQLERPQ
ncbi:MAG: ligase-associated DNA damage response endonuclease PdeM [Alphaproteobacteria bacterium]|nr:ligase-associated DNA damage response endonuclease PdeM [Alphaproteobacteria bacterium]